MISKVLKQFVIFSCLYCVFAIAVCSQTERKLIPGIDASKQLKELLGSISHLPMNIQKDKLADELNLWKGNLEQVDDVTVIGIRI